MLALLIRKRCGDGVCRRGKESPKMWPSALLSCASKFAVEMASVLPLLPECLSCSKCMLVDPPLFLCLLGLKNCVYSSRFLKIPVLLPTALGHRQIGSHV